MSLKILNKIKKNKGNLVENLNNKHKKKNKKVVLTYGTFDLLHIIANIPKYLQLVFNPSSTPSSKKRGSKLYLGVKFRTYLFFHKRIGINTPIRYN